MTDEFTTPQACLQGIVNQLRKYKKNHKLDNLTIANKMVGKYSDSLIKQNITPTSKQKELLLELKIQLIGTYQNHLNENKDES